MRYFKLYRWFRSLHATPGHACPQFLDNYLARMQCKLTPIWNGHCLHRRVWLLSVVRSTLPTGGPNVKKLNKACRDGLPTRNLEIVNCAMLTSNLNNNSRHEVGVYIWRTQFHYRSTQHPHVLNTLATWLLYKNYRGELIDNTPCVRRSFPHGNRICKGHCHTSNARTNRRHGVKQSP